MLAQLQEHLSKKNHSLALKLLTRKGFTASLMTSDYCKLVNIVESGINNISFHTKDIKGFPPKIALTLYCIIIMNSKQQYNTKIAIEFLTRYYRSLQNDEQPWHGKTMKTIANLLLRIPTFSNYKLVIKHISQDLTPVTRILEHRQKMKKQCPHLYEEHVVNSYKSNFPQLIGTPVIQNNLQNRSILNEEEDQYQIISSDNNNYSLDQEVKTLIERPFKEGFQKLDSGLEQMQHQDQLYLQLFNRIQLILQNQRYLIRRVKSVMREEIEIENIFKSLQEILDYKIVEKRVVLSEEIKKMRNKVVNHTKNWAFEFITELMLKSRYCLLRKLGWVNQIITAKLMEFYNQWTSVDLLPIISLIKTYFDVYGPGFNQYRSLLFTSEASLLNLIKSICLNPHSVQQNQYKSMNVQSKKKTPNKPTISLSLNPSLIDTPYQLYLNQRTTQAQRQQILFQCLNLFISYLKPIRKNWEINEICQKDLSYFSQLVDILENSKNSLSFNVKRKMFQLNRVLYQGVGSGVQGEFWNFCERTFEQLFRRKSQKSLSTYKIPDIYIEPSRKIKRQIMNTQKEQASHEIRKTKSFDLALEGWSSSQNNKSDKKSSEKRSLENNGSMSEMFYSVKQCSVIQEKDENNEQVEQEFVLTPNFD